MTRELELERRLEAHRTAGRIADWDIHDSGYDVYLWQAAGLAPAYYWLTSDQAAFLAEVLDSAAHEGQEAVT